MNRDIDFTDVSDSSNTEGCAIIDGVNFLNYKDDALETCTESADLFFKSLQLGRIRGIVTIAGSTGSSDGDHIELLKELIKDDMFVITYGYPVEEIEKAGLAGSGAFKWTGDGLSEFCSFLNIAPVIHTKGMKNPAIADFCSSLAVHVSGDAAVLPLAVIKSHDQQNDTAVPGAVFSMAGDPVKTADQAHEHIHNKRLELGWSDRCGTRFSPFS